MGRSIIFQFGRTFRTIEDLYIMSLQEGEINDGVKALQFKGLVCKYLNFIPQAAKQRMSSPRHCILIFALSVDLFIFIKFQGHHVSKLGRSERTHSSCPVTN